jgi:hypothetical protein
MTLFMERREYSVSTVRKYLVEVPEVLRYLMAVRPSPLGWTEFVTLYLRIL